MQEEKYQRWKQENHIDSLSSLHAWMNENVSDGRYKIYLHEDIESYDLMMRFLEGLPINRETAEEIMQALEEYDFLYYEDEVRELLNRKYRVFLTD